MFIRFPVPVFLAIATSILAIAAAETEGSPLAEILGRWSLVCGAAFVACLLVDLLCLARNAFLWVRIIASSLALAAVLASSHVLVPPALEDARPPFWYGFWILLFSLHLGIALSPLVASRDTRILWSFNLRLFLRFFFSSVNAALLFFGLALALGSIDQLFNVHFNEESYVQIWFFAAFAAHPLLFLGGVPRLDEMDLDEDFPRPLRFTLQFIALPLVGVYLLILYVYIGKIAVMARWPDGWVAMPIFFLSVTGTLAAVLCLPLAGAEAWARLFHRWLYRLLLPLSVVLFLALQVRLQDYGMTINRYLALALAVWLFGISLSYVIRPRLHIAWLPGSLLVVSLFSIGAGTFGAFGWSTRSQVERIRSIATVAGALQDGVFVKSRTPDKVSNEERRQLESGLYYMMEHFGFDPLKAELEGFLAINSNQSTRHTYHYQQAQDIMSFLGFNQRASVRESSYYYPYLALPADGHQWCVPLDFYPKTLPHSIEAGQPLGTLRFGALSDEAVIECSAGESVRFQIELGEWVNDIPWEAESSAPDLLEKPVFWDYEANGWRFRYVLRSATLSRPVNGPPELSRTTGFLFYTPPD